MIPVWFTFDGKEYAGTLNKVSGGAGQLYHLMVGKFYWGQLILTDNLGWQFHAQSKDMNYLSEYFGEVVQAWYE